MARAQQAVSLPASASGERLIKGLSDFKERFVGFYLSMEEQFFGFQLIGRQICSFSYDHLSNCSEKRSKGRNESSK